MNIIEKFITNNDCYKSNVANVDDRYTDFQNNGSKGNHAPFGAGWIYISYIVKV